MDFENEIDRLADEFMQIIADQEKRICALEERLNNVLPFRVIEKEKINDT